MSKKKKSKPINPGFCQAINIGKDEKEEKVSPFSQKIRDIAGKISNWKIFYSRIGRTFKFFDDVEMFGFTKACKYDLERTISDLTLANFRARFEMGIEYFKVGYNSADYDSMCALREFAWKLDRIGKHLKEHNLKVGAEADAKRIAKVSMLINRVIEDDYLEEFEQQVVEKYGDDIRYEARCDDKQMFGFANKGKGPFKNGNCACVTMHKREKWTPENHYEIEKAERAKYTKAHNKRMREWRQALRIIENHIFEWWD